MDETSWSLRGRPSWLWTGVTYRLSFFRLAARRSGWARQRLLGRRFRGRVTSDRLLTVAETCKKQKRDLLGYLTAAIVAHRNGMLPPALIATA